MGAWDNFDRHIWPGVAHAKDQAAEIRICFQRGANLDNDRVEQAIASILRAVCDI